LKQNNRILREKLEEKASHLVKPALSLGLSGVELAQE